MYQPGCGLAAVYMSWSAYEYLYLILLKNKTALPPVARVKACSDYQLCLISTSVLYGFTATVQVKTLSRVFASGSAQP